ncbi:MAG: RNA methyltransferase [Bacteroidaceae bacterium]|nr:RNA methyltransferase [Bacteroidaceae bacterium]
MFSSNDIKTIRSLEHKKFRDRYGLFVAEGSKLTGMLAGHFKCVLYATTGTVVPDTVKADRTEFITRKQLERASLMRNPQDVIALFRIPVFQADMARTSAESLTLALDGIQDPGNLGTIVRIADWFGISEIFCSSDCTDIYGPKAVQATMGAMARVHIHYVDLASTISALPPGTPVYGTFLDGDNIYSRELTSNGVIIMGNEGNGISREVSALAGERLFIPSWPGDTPTSESLNVAAATSIICAEFRRRNR